MIISSIYGSGISGDVSSRRSKPTELTALFRARAILSQYLSKIKVFLQNNNKKRVFRETSFNLNISPAD
jgi:hypothetical protein